MSPCVYAFALAADERLDLALRAWRLAHGSGSCPLLSQVGSSVSFMPSAALGVIARLKDVALASMMRVNVFRCRSTASAVLRLSNISSPRAVSSVSRESPLCLRILTAATLEAHSRLRYYSSTLAPSSLPIDAMDTDAQRAHPTEIEGQSGRRYKIERVLQDKGSLLGRVFLATYVIPRTASVIY